MEARDNKKRRAQRAGFAPTIEDLPKISIGGLSIQEAREMTPTSVHPLDKIKAHASDPIKQPKYDPSLSLDGEISKNLNPNKILS